MTHLKKIAGPFYHLFHNSLLDVFASDENLHTIACNTLSEQLRKNQKSLFQGEFKAIIIDVVFAKPGWCTIVDAHMNCRYVVQLSSTYQINQRRFTSPTLDCKNNHTKSSNHFTYRINTIYAFEKLAKPVKLKIHLFNIVKSSRNTPNLVS